MVADSSSKNKQASLPLPRWKKLLFSAVVFFFVAAFLEVSAIWYLKIFDGYDGKHLLQYEFDPYKNILPARNYVDTRGIRHNSQGFRRTNEVPIEKPPGTYRIFLMGGSTAYGLGGLWPHLQREYAVIDNKDTIDAYLERYLAKAFPNREIEVINAAITSAWTHHHLIYLNQTIFRFDPDMVIFLDGYNDFYHWAENHDQFVMYAYQERSRVIMGDPSLYSLGYTNMWWLFRKSAFAHLAFRTIREFRKSITNKPPLPPMDVEQSLQSLQSVYSNNALKMIERMALMLRAEGVAGVFVIQPMLILERGRSEMPEFERKLFEFNVKFSRINYESYIHRAVQYVSERERNTVEPLGGFFINGTGIYKDAKEQIFTDYTHLTPKGNEILAEYIGARIIPRIRATTGRR